MMKFSTSLLTVTAVATLCCAEANADALAKASNSLPKVISSCRETMLTSADKHISLRKPAKKLESKFLGRKRAAKVVDAAGMELLYSCSFDFLSEGSETDPAPLELDDWDNIPEELIGEANYGFGGQGLMQAGGAVYIPFEYNEDPDSDDGWYLEGMLWTPDVYEPMVVTIELDAKIVEECDVDTDEFWAYASDYDQLIGYDSAEVSKEWSHLSLSVNVNSFIPETEYDSYYFTLFVDGGADIVVKNVVMKGEKAALQVPVALNYSDFTGESFSANWSEVAGATGYYLTVYNFDPATRSNTSVFLDAQFVEDTHYTVSGLTPGNFYSYQVTATDGSFTTSPSNFIVVCELLPPTEVSLKAGSDNDSLVASWSASAGANYYVLTANSVLHVKAGQPVTLADADFSGIQSTGTVASPVESDFWYDSLPELPGWEFTLGCSASGAYGFWDNAYYTSMTGLYASLSSMDYDLSNIKDGKVSVSVEAASPGNGMLVGLLNLNEETNNYDVADVYGTPGDIPEDYETYTFDLNGASANSQFLFITRTMDNADGAVLIRRLQVSATAATDGTVGMPVGTVQTEATEASIATPIENGVNYSAVVVPYLVDNNGYILATGQPSAPVTFNTEMSGVSFICESESATYYNLQGQRIDHPSKGTLVIKVTPNKTTKSVF